MSKSLFNTGTSSIQVPADDTALHEVIPFHLNTNTSFPEEMLNLPFLISLVSVEVKDIKIAVFLCHEMWRFSRLHTYATCMFFFTMYSIYTEFVPIYLITPNARIYASKAVNSIFCSAVTQALIVSVISLSTGKVL